jgi:hypothetical protein
MAIVDEGEDDKVVSVAEHQGKLLEALRLKIAEAAAKGMSKEGVVRLDKMLMIYQDVFRLRFMNDPSVNVTPLEVKLREGAERIVCKARRYSPLHKDFLRKHLAEIVIAGLGYDNNRSSWASPPRIVNKKDSSFRMTVDTRGPNSKTIPMHWPCRCWKW